ncbi:MAG: HNH endonuclease [Candidatus Peribacteraceae bacterium]|nr:HNH endonuclease [Candidatus Peribacteraceae bacterium]
MRVGIYSIREVIQHVPNGIQMKPPPDKCLHRVEFDGDMIRMDSLRYQLFKTTLKCAACGIEGKFFAKEKSSLKSINESFHFNLYAIRSDGNEVLMTKDHVIPKSKGGAKNHISNLQVMCAPCNSFKGNSTEEENDRQ